MECLRKVLARPADLETKANCVLAMGQTAEQMDDYESALRFYKEAFALEPTSTRIWRK